MYEKNHEIITTILEAYQYCLYCTDALTIWQPASDNKYVRSDILIHVFICMVLQLIIN